MIDEKVITEITEVELDKMSKSQLMRRAVDLGIKISSASRKQEIIDDILNERGFTDESVKKEHFKILKQDEDKAIKARGIDMFYKLKGKYQDKIDITNQIKK